MTDKYHIVREKDSPRIYIESNRPNYGLRNGIGGRNIEFNIASFNKYSPRKPIICSNNKFVFLDYKLYRIFNKNSLKILNIFNKLYILYQIFHLFLTKYFSFKNLIQIFEY